MIMSIEEQRRAIAEAVTEIRGRTAEMPQTAVILGTGLGKTAELIEQTEVIEYQDIPNFPVSTVESHKGRLIFGTVGDKSVVAMQGRFHLYEGYSAQQLVFPVRVMRALGAEALLISNACGALNHQFKTSDMMFITDHINLLGTNPLIGPNDDSLGPRFPDMSRAYSRRLLSIAENIAQTENILYRKGTYVAVPGPNLETPAEYRYLHIIGADAVGMSTVPEVLAARHCGMEVFGISIITDEGYHDELPEVSLADVIKAAAVAEPEMTRLFARLIAEI
ncbi:purine-nucleoside phosphorylase [Ignavibacteria bacterium]|nr:purine-nucleoside phosphorylase [Bacteroidota bacterium]MCZ2131745.1 purine-nucleoside phosphorylase [Bacteroidota bacterium]